MACDVQTMIHKMENEPFQTSTDLCDCCNSLAVCWPHYHQYLIIKKTSIIVEKLQGGPPVQTGKLALTEKDFFYNKLPLVEEPL